MVEADLVLHAGDVTAPEALEEMQALAPIRAVLGNNDTQLMGHLPERLELDLGGVRLAMVHDSGARAGRAGRLHRWFPEAAVVVFGHSHIPVCEEGVEGQLLLNPGSPTDKRSQPVFTMGELILEEGRVGSARILAV
jgi:putative phosphoesterase